MIRSYTGVNLTPGNQGCDCKGNGRHYDKKGKLIECCCEDCGYLLCCISTFSEESCKTCKDLYCPHSPKNPFNILKKLFNK